MSVWTGIDRNAFDECLRHLHAKCERGFRFIGPSIPSLAPIDAGTVGPSLCSTVEWQLAQHCAFLASDSTERGKVSAAAVSYDFAPPRLDIVVTANKGVTPGVKCMFLQIKDILRARADGQLGRPATFRQCQAVIVLAHQRRILGRLRHFRNSARGPVGILDKVRDLIAFVSNPPGGRLQVDLDLTAELEKLQDCILRSKQPDFGERDQHTTVKDMIVISRNLMACDERVARLRFFCEFRDHQDNQIGDRVLREVQALATYWKLMRDLTLMAKMYPELFRTLNFEIPDIINPAQNNESQAYVHAEIQILLYFELHKARRPRYICASKKPCVLCYLFMRAYSIYEVPRTHGEAYQNWTISDDLLLNTSCKARLNSALKKTFEDAKLLMKMPDRPSGHAVEYQPQQTVSKLFWDDLASLAETESISTSSTSSSDTITPGPSSILQRFYPRSSEDLQSLQNRSSQLSSNPFDLGAVEIGTRGIITDDKCQYFQSTSLELFLETEEPYPGSEVVVVLEPRAHGGLPLTDVEHIDVDDIDANGLQLETDDARQLRFILSIAGVDHLVGITWSIKAPDL